MMPPITLIECARWFVFSGCAAMGWVVGKAVLVVACTKLAGALGWKKAP
jgi:hypothetical protein